MKVRLDKVSKRFGDALAVDEVSLEISDGELFFLLGPSGCGKTTLLRLLAGFYQPDSGSIFFGDQCVNQLPAEHRNCGMVFQNYALWPHLTVEENVAYGLEVRKVAKAEKKERVREALSIVQMNDYAQRRPNQLSGGQQQRVALARAIVIQPHVLLLDEPLSNLDARLRLSMRDEIRRIHSQTGITTLYVTHDQTEALSMAHRMAILRQGKVEQIDTPTDLYQKPKSVFATEFLGETNWLSGTVQKNDGKTVNILTDNFLWSVSSSSPWEVEEKVKIGFRPESVSFSDKYKENFFPAVVYDTLYLGSLQETLLKCDFFQAKLLRTVELNPGRIYQKGEHLNLSLSPEKILIFRDTP